MKADFQQITRSQSFCGVIDARAELERNALELLRAQFPVTKGIRLLGISIFALVTADAADTRGTATRSTCPAFRRLILQARGRVARSWKDCELRRTSLCLSADRTDTGRLPEACI